MSQDPVFLSGGLKEPPEPAGPVGLPEPNSVLRASVMLDALGRRWKSSGIEWLRVQMVTAAEYRALKRRSRTVGYASLTLLLAGLVVCTGYEVGLLSVSRWGWLGFPLVLIAGGLGWWWLKQGQRQFALEIIPVLDSAAASGT
ncbi:hypothetical protein [Leifsonia aquatica]|uniref:hypothetical protein n=1 Tax=Leifsonia aquatica TaxID=144185 RepID=UPI003805E71C